jgi:hypothetical protein
VMGWPTTVLSAVGAGAARETEMCELVIRTLRTVVLTVYQKQKGYQGEKSRDSTCGDKHDRDPEPGTK